MEYSKRYLDEVCEVARRLDPKELERMVDELIRLREGGGRLFFVGVGGGAGNAIHAINDFRKIAGIEAYSPVENVPELTARINDDGWESAFAEWLKGYGNLMIINHGENYYSLYAHVEEVFKKTGEKVQTGEVIATAGDTGSIKGLCLHFELRHHGKPINPLKWLKKGA